MKQNIVRIALAAAIAALCAGPVWAQKFVHITDLHISTNTDALPARGEFDQDGRNFAKLRDAIVAAAPAFVICTGDIVNSGLNNDGTNDANNWAALTGKLYKSGSTYYMKSNYTIPIYFVPGNHDGRNRGQHPNPAFQSFSAFDSYIGKAASVPSGFTITWGSGETARDFYMANSQMVLVGLTSGKDDILTGPNLWNPEGSGLTTAQITFINTAFTAYPNRVKVIAMHHPAVNPNGKTNNGTDFRGDPFEGVISHVYDGCIKNNRTGTGSFIERCTNSSVPIILTGHLHQNVVLDNAGTKQTESWTGVKYIQTAEGFNGVYRVVNVTSTTAYTIGAPSKATNLYPAAKNSEWAYNLKPIVAGIANNIRIAMDKVAPLPTKLQYYVDGVLQSTINNPPANVVLPYMKNSAKSTTSILKVVVTNSVGTTTSNYPLAVLTGTDSWYGRWAINDAHNIIDPITGTAYTFKLMARDSDYQLHFHIIDAGGAIKDEMVVQKGTPKRTTYLPFVFIWVTNISTVGQPNDVMVAPYITPSATILKPFSNVATNNADVTVNLSYSGKDIPWMSAPSSPFIYKTDFNYFRTLTYNGTAANTDGDYLWTMSGSNGARTMTATVTDKFGTATSDMVTVNYNSSLSWYTYRGEYGDTWKGKSLSSSLCGSYGCIYVNFWNGTDQMGEHWQGNAQVFNRDMEIDMYAEYFKSGVMSGGAGTLIYVVKRDEYLNSSITGGKYGTVYYKEIYNKLAHKLGVDASGKYRVWASLSAGSRGVADAIIPTPDLTTTNITQVNSTSVLSGGNIITNGGSSVTARGVCWSTSQFPTTSNSKTVDGSGSGSFTSSVAGLTAGATYYIRAYATNSAGTSYGNEISFATVFPTVTTTAASAIGLFSATSGGYVNGAGVPAVTARGVCWNTSGNPTTANSKTVDGSGSGSFTSSLTGLTSGTTYYVRAYATNSAGTVYAPQISFTTLSPNYCTISGYADGFLYIRFVNLGTINNSSGSQGYANFTNLSTNIARGAAYTVNYGLDYNYIHRQVSDAIYIDFNADGDFSDSGENIYRLDRGYSGSSANNWTTYTAPFTVPSTATLGYTRMRVVVDYYYPSYPAKDCGQLNKGEAEDYTVNITAAKAGDFVPEMPKITQLLSSNPNPFTSHTVISYQLAAPAQVTIKVYDIAGRLVRTLISECLRPGQHNVRWDCRDANGNKVAAGLYLYRMESGDYSKTNKMTVLR